LKEVQSESERNAQKGAEIRVMTSRTRKVGTSVIGWGETKGCVIPGKQTAIQYSKRSQRENLGVVTLQMAAFSRPGRPGEVNVAGTKKEENSLYRSEGRNWIKIMLLEGTRSDEGKQTISKKERRGP